MVSNYYVILFLTLIPNMDQQVEWCKQYNLPSVEEGTATALRSKGFYKIKFNHTPLSLCLFTIYTIKGPDFSKNHS